MAIEFNQSTLYQNVQWYNKNKDNFKTSWKMLFRDTPPSLNIKYASPPLHPYTPNPEQYFGEFLHFGVLRQLNIKFPDNNIIYPLYYVAIPPGFRIYHSSRTLGLNHSDFPIRIYDKNLSEQENKRLNDEFCPYPERTLYNPLRDETCTNVSYYSLPIHIKQYLYYKNPPGYSQAYRYTEESNNLRPYDPLFSIFNKTKADKDGYIEGINPYVTTKQLNLLIFGFDTIRYDKLNLGRHNMIQIKLIIEYLQRKGEYLNIIENRNNIDLFGGAGVLNMEGTIKVFCERNNKDTYRKKLYYNLKNIVSNIINTSYCQPPLEENMSIEYSELLKSAKDVETLLLSYKDQVETKNYSKFGENSHRVYSSLIEEPIISKFLRLPGYRASTFETDKPLINMIADITKKFTRENIKDTIPEDFEIHGLGSTTIINFVRPTFHPEIVLWFPPAVLKREFENPWDINYKNNYHEILQEYRKYITTNTNFHKGDLFEHSSWVALQSIYLVQELNSPDINIPTQEIFILGGILHDIAKAGLCPSQYATFKDFDEGKLLLSKCNVKIENYFQYFDIPDHPERGYRNLIGLEVFNAYKFFKNDESLPIFFDKLINYLQKRTTYTIENIRKYIKFIRIATACHWAFGDYLLRNYHQIITIPQQALKYIYMYLSKIEMYFNAEFYYLQNSDRKQIFKDVLYFVMIISMADMLGSQYDSSGAIIDRPDHRIYNEYPTHPTPNTQNRDFYHQFGGITKKALLRKFHDLYRIVFTYLITYDNSRNISFPDVLSNNYLTLEAFLYNTQDIKTLHKISGKYFPKVLSFDLDGTLLSFTMTEEGPVYQWLPGAVEIIQELQYLRTKGVCLAVMSRHYLPDYLLDFLRSDNSPIKLTDFDIVVSFYTGSNNDSNYKKFLRTYRLNEEEIYDFMYSKGFDIFYFNRTSRNGENLNIQKNYHVNFIIQSYIQIYHNDLKNEDIVLFDDDIKYISKEGIFEDVFVVQVPKYGMLEDKSTGISRNIEYPLDLKIIKESLAIICYKRLQKTNKKSIDRKIKWANLKMPVYLLPAI